MFDFKLFRIDDSACAQKVGTDSVLLGAWANMDTAESILDLGCGSGLLSLMAAQRTNANIVGIDIDDQALCQASHNARMSPFRERISFERFDARDFLNLPSGELTQYDAVISNPPYFSERIFSPSAERHAARNQENLSFSDLAQVCARILAPDGLLHLVLPTDKVKLFIAQASLQHLYLSRRCNVVTSAGKPPRLSLLEFQRRNMGAAEWVELTLFDQNGRRTPQHHQLTKDFYLW